MNRNKTLVAGGVSIAGASVASAADPTSLDGFLTVAQGYLTNGTTIAISAAVLGLGWVGYTIVKSYTKGAKSK